MVGSHETGEQNIPRLQILPAAAILEGGCPQAPFGHSGGLKKAAKEVDNKIQGRLLLDRNVRLPAQIGFATCRLQFLGDYIIVLCRGAELIMADNPKAEHQRIVLLNTLVSRSTTHARNHIPPTDKGSDLLRILEDRRLKGWALEYCGRIKDVELDEEDEAKRIKDGQGHDYIRLCKLVFEDSGDFEYVTGLVEYLDTTVSKFAVVDYQTLQGHELTGKQRERGAVTAHFMVRIPKEDVHDDGKYRCAIEVVNGITRSDIEMLLCRQLRRFAKATSLTFTGERKGKPHEYKYTPKLELFADVGRKLDVAVSGEGQLSGMLFTKRKEKQSTADKTDVAHEDFLADVKVFVGANQGPPDPQEKLNWAERIQTDFRLRGYDTKVYFRHANGGLSTGELHKSVSAATDLLMCQREHISLAEPPKNWAPDIQSEIAAKMREILDKSSLWLHRN